MNWGYQEISNNHPPSSAPGSTENIVLFQAAYVIGELYRPRGTFQLSFKVIPQTWPPFAYRAEPSIESKQVKKSVCLCFFSSAVKRTQERTAASTCSLSLKAQLILKQSSSFSSKYSCFFRYSTLCWIIKVQWSCFVSYTHMALLVILLQGDVFPLNSEMELRWEGNSSLFRDG